jgi:hypothetical protein
MRIFHVFVAAAALIAAAACHPGPVVDTGPKPAVGGTIAGIVSTDGKAPVPGRRVLAINTTDGTQYDATTGVNGGYTIKVPQGTYRLEVELRAGETVARQPAPTHVNRSDLDPQREFVITGVRSGG